MDPVNITPKKVRGLGNILSTKYSSDYITNNIQFLLSSNTPVIKLDTNSNYYSFHAVLNAGMFKGAVLADGWDNTGLWEVSFEVSYPEGLRYTGLILLADADNPKSGWGIKNWEGPITGNPRIDGGTASFTKVPDNNLTDLPNGAKITNNPVVSNWYTLHMKKTSLTTLEVWKNNDLKNKVTYNWQELSAVKKVTIGGSTNSADSSAYGKVYIRNIKIFVTEVD